MKNFLYRIGRFLLIFFPALILPPLVAAAITYRTSFVSEALSDFLYHLKWWEYYMWGNAIYPEAGWYRLFRETGGCGPYVWKWKNPGGNWRQGSTSEK